MANYVKEPSVLLGKYSNGVLEMRSSIKKLADDTFDDEYYEDLRKVIFPANLEEVESYLFSNQENLEVLDFSKVTKLSVIPEDFVGCETKIKEFIIPMGVTEVGDEFIRESNPDTKIYVPASVKKLGSVNSNSNNDQYVYLFASGINLESVEEDVHTLYVLPKDYDYYAEQLQEMGSEARLREIPEEMLTFYSTHQDSAASEVTPESVVVPEPAPSAPVTPPMPSSRPEVPASPVQSRVGITEEFKELLQEYLTDGIITQKERMVLLNKANKLGIDVDEADLYIDAQVQKFDQEIEVAMNKKKGRLCPHCQAPVPLMADECPHCHQYITPEATKELEEIINNLENALVNFKAGRNIAEAKAQVERYARKAKLYYEKNPKVNKLLDEISFETKKAEKEAKKQIVLNALARKWKLIACVVAVIVLAVVIKIANRPSIESDPQVCIEEVNKALNKGDIGKAESICSAYYQSNSDSYDDVEAIGPAVTAIIRYQSKELTNLINAGDMDGASAYLQELNIHPAAAHSGTGNVVKYYDSIFLKLIKTFVDNGDLDSAESVALVWRSKISNDLSWIDSSCYTLLKNKYKSVGRDFSLLKSEYDW